MSIYGKRGGGKKDEMLFIACSKAGFAKMPKVREIVKSFSPRLASSSIKCPEITSHRDPLSLRVSRNSSGEFVIAFLSIEYVHHLAV